ncbi:hypothetical protein [Vibrio parahaemolyticus]|uniref:hypothetical protein n=1 Tax=Vibrio parahaemolyticus TaxID=670 RepID=UPI00111E178F|nr:hypothetical protein [Vibrio parahaemolyticus]MBE5192810.1 hypothetical protein [Vibrio parahaemolyticus]MCG6510422.1 hypothetical protein [Vibrio parahaemolyticus]TOI43181.1 hypothetical protein CGI61_05050 [Vibrio parahaemolyticus]HCE2108590.1 hypothetical protein [Vibrio parahaemolyticus]HCG6302114.1 hypothetical protein [Vibrio parahaemolyticus]
MAVTHYSVYRSEHYKRVKQAIDNATERNSINVSKRYYSNTPELSENKTFVHYLLDELIEQFGANYYYRTEVVESLNPVKSQIHKQLEADQLSITGFEQLFEINVRYIKNLYPARFKSFETIDELFVYLMRFPTISYMFDCEVYNKKDAIKKLTLINDNHL